MIALRLHRDLYPGECVDEAARALEGYASLERVEEASHWVVRVTASSAERERRVAGELGNRALGLAVRRGR